MPAGEYLKSLAKRVLPESATKAIQQRRRIAMLSGRTPVSRCFGVDRGGRAIDRHYIERFLRSRKEDIKGKVLEVGDCSYTRKFGGDHVESSDVLHVDAQVPGVTIVGDLATGEGIPNSAFDCVICTQTLMFVYEVRAAITNVHRSLRPGGVALVSVSGISQICRFDMDRWGDYWRFTSASIQRLFGETFPAENVMLKTYGNSFAAVALLQGLTAEELSQEELDAEDRDYEMIVAVRALKPGPVGDGS